MAIFGTNKAQTGEQKIGNVVVEDGVALDRWSVKKDSEFSHRIAIGPTEQVSLFLVWNTIGSQFISAAARSSDTKLVTARIAGGISNYSHSILAGVREDPTEVGVVYYCSGLGVAMVHLTVQIGSFDPVEIEWEKNCGGGYNSRLRVGTMYDQWNVVRGGRVQAAWNPLQATKEVVTPVSGDQVSKNFYITAETDAIFDAMATADGGNRACIPETIIAKHGPRTFKLTVYHYCKQDGPIRISVVLIQQLYMPVEWHYTKICNQLLDQEQTTPYWTASQLLWLVAFTGISTICFLCCCFAHAPPCSFPFFETAQINATISWCLNSALGKCCRVLWPRHQRQGYAKVAVSPDVTEREHPELGWVSHSPSLSQNRQGGQIDAELSIA